MEIFCVLRRLDLPQTFVMLIQIDNTLIRSLSAEIAASSTLAKFGCPSGTVGFIFFSAEFSVIRLYCFIHLYTVLYKDHIRLIGSLRLCKAHFCQYARLSKRAASF